MPELQTHKNVELNQKELDAVVRSFDYILNNPDLVNSDEMGLSSLEELAQLAQKIKTYQNPEQEDVSIPMNFAEWVTYTPYVDLAKEVVEDEHDGQIMEDLSDKYDDMEQSGTSLDVV